MTARMLWCMAVVTRVLGAQGMAAAPLLRSEPAVTSREAVVLGLTTLTAVAVIPLDLRIAAWMRDSAQHRSPLIDNVLTGGRLFGAPGSIIIGTALWAGGALASDNATASDGLRSLEAVAIGSIVTILVKRIVGRAPPSASTVDARNFSLGRGFGAGKDYQSFPSGHTTAAFAFASAVTARVSKRSPSQASWLGPLLYGAASLTGVSRIYDGSHWFSDVVMGAGIGTVTGLLLTRHLDHRP